MKKNSFFTRKLLALLLVVICVFTTQSTVFAQDELNIDSDTVYIDVPIEDGELFLTKSDLERGKTISIVIDENGMGHIVSSKGASLYESIGIFDIDLGWTDSMFTSLGWTAIIPYECGGLKNVTGELYVKSTSILNLTPYYYQGDIHCPALDGTTYIASNQESTAIRIDDDESSVRVGWKSLVLYGIKSSLRVSNGSSVVHSPNE